ncbi:putative peptidase, S24 family [Treponema primitia ZAS-2]|uniref:Putative peptidase, S24 family n=1 Tax=Treponema primitia (strain ATCC BAA-887 / DSM 12427 / ZAS-2) TaxID=545694 RepID=F5YQE0_TREPZ|nr:S24 family peptidase [Treponema primitia]AEF86139.1 putative peptidase, S24 family [Treponema primitia ZAS-2]
MDNEGKRYDFIRGKVGLSKKDFAKSLGLSMSMGSQISSGLLKPSRSLLDRLAEVYNVNLHWFLTGNGPSGLDPDTVEIELLDQEAAAGHGRAVEEYPQKRVFQIPRNLIGSHPPDLLMAVYVAGDSMIEAHICDGDIAIFYPGITEGNGIFVVSIGNSLVVKRVDRDIASQTIVLYSANPTYEPRRFTGEELAGISIAGRVVACYHKV